MYRYSVRIICRHCSRAKVVRPRGLCWSCFYKPGGRDKEGRQSCKHVESVTDLCCS
jgi:hypothetical protein